MISIILQNLSRHGQDNSITRPAFFSIQVGHVAILIRRNYENFFIPRVSFSSPHFEYLNSNRDNIYTNWKISSRLSTVDNFYPDFICAGKWKCFRFGNTVFYLFLFFIFPVGYNTFMEPVQSILYVDNRFSGYA